MVDLAKLKFFQTRFTRDLISGAISDPTALSRRIIKPIQSDLEQLSQDLANNSASELVAEVLAGEEPRTRISVERKPKEHTEESIHEVLKASKGPMDNHRQFIRDNLYAFWSPSPLAYKNSFKEFQSGMTRIKMTRKKEKVLNTDISKVLRNFRNSLDELAEEEWTLEKVGNKAKDLADSVTYYNTERDIFMENGAGWKFLRWGLLVGMPGLSVVPMMVLLGKEETRTRLRIARRAATVLEEKLAVEARKAAKLQDLSRLHTEVMGQSTGKSQVSPDDQVSEPRNIKIKIREVEPVEAQDKAKWFLRPIQPESNLPEKGPFVSQPQPRLLPVQRPGDLPRRHFLNFEEFRTGSRHILAEKQPEPAHKHPQPRPKKPAKFKPVRRPEPADEINPFEPGGSFFAPDPEETGTRSSQAETTPSPTRTQQPSDDASHKPQRDKKTQPEAFQGLSDSERRRLHFRHLMLEKAYEKKRRAEAAQRLGLGESTTGHPVKQPGAAPDGAPGPLGAFYAGPVVNHPLRLKASGRLARDDKDGRLPQDEVDTGRRTELAELEQNLKESWVERGRSNLAKNADRER